MTFDQHYGAHLSAYRKALAASLAFSAAAVAAIVLLLVLCYSMWGAFAAGSLLGCAGLFCWLFIARPHRCYLQVIRAMRADRHHTETYVFNAYAQDTSLREGVPMRPVRLQYPDGQDRLLFMLDDLPRPQLQAGEKVTVRFSGHVICEIAAAQPQAE